MQPQLLVTVMLELLVQTLGRSEHHILDALNLLIIFILAQGLLDVLELALHLPTRTLNLIDALGHGARQQRRQRRRRWLYQRVRVLHGQVVVVVSQVYLRIDRIDQLLVVGRT